MTILAFDDEAVSWWHGNIDRIKAERLLESEQCPSNGALFLVRHSQSFCVISLYDGRKKYHHQIRQIGNDAFFGLDDTTPVHGLEVLVKNLQKNSTFGINLVSFVKNEPPPDLYRATGMASILHKALKFKNMDMIDRLFNCDYKSVNAKDENGKTVVHLVCENSELDSQILKKIIDGGVNVDTFDLAGNKPIHYACGNRGVDVVQMLIDRRVNLQRSNFKTGNTPLHEAVRSGNFEVVKLLLTNGVNSKPINKNSEFPIDIAKGNGFADIENMLKLHVQSVKTKREDWYHEMTDRAKAEKSLRNHADSYYEKYRNIKNSTVNDEEEKSEITSGIFLVRSSPKGSDPSQLRYVISLLNKNEIKNYIIQTKENYYFLESGPYMDSLEHLVEYYSKYSDGIPVCLKEGVKKENENLN